MPHSYLGIDLGATKCAGALVSEDGKIITQTKSKIAGLKGDKAGAVVIQVCKNLMDQARTNEMDISGIGVSIPGISYEEKGTVWAPNIPGWEDYPLKSKLKHAFEPTFDVVVDNDRACSILGEQWQGAAQGCENAIYLAFGTGIGAGIIAGGQILRGQSDIAGAIGWMALDDKYLDGYKQFGCFEFNASGDGLCRLAKHLYTSDDKYSTSHLSSSHFTSTDIFESYAKNDVLAVEVINLAITYWGKGVANLVSIFNPEKIIFGGGLFGPALKFLPDIYEKSKRYAQPVAIEQVELCGGMLGNDAQLLGAALLSMNKKIIYP